jgi:hypothetical protein
MTAHVSVAALFALAGLLVASMSCHAEGCGDVGNIEEPTIQVVDTVTGDPICNATIAVSGMLAQVTSDAGCPPLDPSACTYYPCWGGGTYSIEVSAVGYATKVVEGVTVSDTTCEPVPPSQQVRVALVPQ